MKIKLNAGIDVRTGPDNDDGTIPTRRLGEAGDVIESDDVAEWDKGIPKWLLKDGTVEEVKEETKVKPTARKK